jgi:hypothetical protein
MNEFNYIDERLDEKGRFGAGSMFIVESSEKAIYCLCASEWSNKNNKVKFRLVAIEEDHACIVLGISTKTFLTGNSVRQKFSLDQVKSLTKGKLCSTLKLRPVKVSLNVKI